MSKQDFFPLISLGNEAPAPRAEGDLAPGVNGIAIANESRLTAGTYQEALTAYVQGWSDTEPLKETVDYIAPPVPVSSRFEFKKLKNAEAFLTEDDDERAIGSGFKRVEYGGETALGKTLNRGLTYRMDRDDETLSEEQVVQLLTKRIYRGKLRRALTVLLALATNTNKTWDGSANPFGDMRTAVAAAQLESGVFPNRGLIGLAGWNLFTAAYETQATAAAFAGISLEPKQVGQRLGLDDFRTERSIYQSSGSAKSRTMTSAAVFFYADVISKDDPSHVKQFVSNGEGLKVHREDIGPKFTDITVEHYESIIGTSTIGATKLTLS